MDTVLEYLQIFVNPWTFLVIIILIFYRRSIELALNNIASRFKDPFEITFKEFGLKFIEKKKKEISDELYKMKPENISTAPSDQQPDLKQVSNALVSKYSSGEIARFYHLFGKENSITVNINTKDRILLDKFQGNFIVNSEYETFMGKKTCKIYTLTEIGRYIIDTISN
jgi:hypothetical protein